MVITETLGGIGPKSALHREYAGKTDVKVYDYIDFHIPMCNTMYKRRMRGYRATGYVVADPCHEGNLFNTAYNSVYGVNEYTSKMIEDLKNAKTSIALALESTYVYKTSPIYKCIKECIARGVRVSAIARKSSVKDDVLMGLGIKALIKNDMCLSSMVINNCLVWYGDINFLGFNEGDETALRLNDVALAEEIIGIISK